MPTIQIWLLFEVASAAFICGYLIGYCRQYARGKAEAERALNRMSKYLRR